MPWSYVYRLSVSSCLPVSFWSYLSPLSVCLSCLLSICLVSVSICRFSLLSFSPSPSIYLVCLYLSLLSSVSHSLSISFNLCLASVSICRFSLRSLSLSIPFNLCLVSISVSSLYLCLFYYLSLPLRLPFLSLSIVPARSPLWKVRSLVLGMVPKSKGQERFDGSSSSCSYGGVKRQAALTVAPCYLTLAALAISPSLDHASSLGHRGKLLYTCHRKCYLRNIYAVSKSRKLTNVLSSKH